MYRSQRPDIDHSYSSSSLTEALTLAATCSWGPNRAAALGLCYTCAARRTRAIRAPGIRSSWPQPLRTTSSGRAQPGRVEHRPRRRQCAERVPEGQCLRGLVERDPAEQAGVPAEHVVADVLPDGRQDLRRDAVDALPQLVRVAGPRDTSGSTSRTAEPAR
jgi:hypothetical protein